MISLRPDLVIIHRSCFYHPVNVLFGFSKDHPYADPAEEEKWRRLYAVCDDKLLLFMAYVATQVPHTKFLVYSRGTDPQWTNDHFRTEVWTKTVETRFPQLKDRIRTMAIPRGYEGSFRHHETRQLLRSIVREIPGLRDKRKPDKRQSTSNTNLQGSETPLKAP